MSKRSLALSRVYRLLEPGPVVLLATAGKKGPNVMTMSWHCMLEFEPPLVGCVVSNRNESFARLRRSKECTLNIPTVELTAKVVAVGNSSGRATDKFAAFGLTPVPAALVAAPLVDECYAALECRVVDGRMVNAYNFFVLEVVKAWVERSVENPKFIHHRGRGEFAVDGEIIRLPSKMK